jgi:hypothetical protein
MVRAAGADRGHWPRSCGWLIDPRGGGGRLLAEADDLRGSGRGGNLITAP